MRKKAIFAGSIFLLGSLVILGLLHWNINRVYVPEGQSLMLRYKGPLIFGFRRPATPGHFAKKGEIGIREQLLGPGRHFYCPIWWDRTLVPDQVVLPRQVAKVTSKLGEPLPNGEFLVDGDLTGPKRAKNKGILRKVFGPGRYRANPYAFEFTLLEEKDDKPNDKEYGWVEIPTGYVGVRTYLSADQAKGISRGIQNNVLPPGLYPINDREQHIDIVEIGYRETSIVVKKVTDESGEIKHDESGEPLAVAESGISFPSNDGFDIQLDFTAIWGVMPSEAPGIVRTFGSIEEAEQKVIYPQSESICRNNGSRMSAVDLLVGETRQLFQIETSEAFQTVLADKGLTLLYGLVRHIYIPQNIRVPIQEGYIADELKLTREQERTTATTQADLKEAEKKVELESDRVIAETTKLVANAIAEGERETKEIAAEAQTEVAQIQKQIALLEAKRDVLLGRAEGDAQRLEAEATAQKFELAVKAFGSPESYNKWEFAEGLPEDIDLNLFYAGEGTLWTDLKGMLPTLPLREAPKKKQAVR